MNMVVAWVCFLFGGGEFFLDHQFLSSLSNQNFLVAPNNNVVVLDTENQELLFFNSKGRRVKTIQGKGSGPGSFRQGKSIYLDGKRIVLKDFLALHAFKLDGSFQKRWITNTKNLIDTFLVGERMFVIWNHEDKQRVEMRSLSLEDPLTIIEWVCPTPSTKYRFVNGHLNVTVNPASEEPYASLSPDSNQLFVREPGTSMVHIIDTRSASLTKSVDLQIKPIPFDEEWGEQVIAQFKKKMRGTRVTAQFPSHFPQITRMDQTPMGLVAARMYSPIGRPSRYVFVDLKGEVFERAPHPEDVWRRVLYIGETYAFFTVYSPGDDAWGVARCLSNEIMRAVTENPIHPSAIE